MGRRYIMQAKVFNKGQVIIPNNLRKKYGIEIGNKVEVKAEADGIKIIPINNNNESIEKLQGIFSKYNKNRILTERIIEEATEGEFIKGL